MSCATSGRAIARGGPPVAFYSWLLFNETQFQPGDRAGQTPDSVRGRCCLSGKPDLREHGAQLARPLGVLLKSTRSNSIACWLAERGVVPTNLIRQSCLDLCRRLDVHRLFREFLYGPDGCRRRGSRRGQPDHKVLARAFRPAPVPVPQCPVKPGGLDCVVRRAWVRFKK